MLPKRWSPSLIALVFATTVFGIQTQSALSAPAWHDAVIAQGSTSSLPHSGKVLAFTDLHFAPFADPDLVPQLRWLPSSTWGALFARSAPQTLAQPGEESNDRLFQTLLDNAKTRSPTPDFILFSGDFLAHHFNERFYDAAQTDSEAALRSFILKTLTYICTQVEERFPGVPVFFTLGNNDAFSGDYALVDGGDFLRASAAPFLAHWIGGQANRVSFQSSYPEHGSYTARLPGLDKTRLISLNSIFFSPRHPDGGDGASATAQLDWLEQQLSQAANAGDRVWLLTHIPPSVDVYATLAQTPNSVVLQWSEAAQARFLEIVRAHASTITFGQAGHTHMDDFRLIFADASQDEALDVIHISPSVSPIFGNNPAFQVYSYDAQSAEVTEIDTYYLNLDPTPAWAWWGHEYDFQATYRTSPDASGFADLYRSIATDGSARADYVQFYGVSIDPPEIADEWKAYWCAIGALTVAQYESQCADVLR